MFNSAFSLVSCREVQYVLLVQYRPLPRHPYNQVQSKNRTVGLRLNQLCASTTSTVVLVL